MHGDEWLVSGGLGDKFPQVQFRVSLLMPRLVGGEVHSTLPDYHGVEAYSALILASDSLGRAKNYSSKGIRAALDKTFMVTPFGPVKFYNYKDFERQNSTQTQVLKIINRKFECIWPLHLCTVGQNSENIGK